MHALIALAVVSIGAAFSPPAAAQSFDCRPYLKKGVVPESVICESPQLAQLDLELAGIYETLMDRLPRSAANNLRNNQRAWLGARNSCGFNANCLVGLYRQRIQDLNSF